MAFKGEKNFSHRSADKVGVLLVNLGTPEAPTAKALRKYLAQFLSDPRVVEIPKLIWMLILHGIILRVRPSKSAEAYKEVWTEDGSPLMLHSLAQTQAIREKLRAEYGNNVMVELAMRYGEPSVSNTLDQMMAESCRKLVVLPLYPQYSGSTTASVFDDLAADFTQRRWLPSFRFISSYHTNPAYINALAQSIQQHWAEHGRCDKLVFSFHGVPQHFLHSGDPYHCQCHVTVRLLAEQLGLNQDEYLTCFQSRFGKAEWLKPYLDATMKSLPNEGVKSVQVVCPGFSSDCLETLEEIAGENKEYFMEAGGERFEYIPALNSRSEHIEALIGFINEEAGAWFDGLSESVENVEREQRYSSHKYNQKNK
ncbi:MULTISPECIES: ferrochelatase [unclassified Oleiphilus]|nr:MULTISPECIES: ferrochelatase [unclassified Oleiphilus]KZY62702.1 ferrochelatase [Oleiphilus sp. HI0066]KZY70831.1 ferrochelatase [Oleiphilus sp. HI0067]KZY70851.1 ferrochelatase [Oleiphilus sp. HI0067]KZZ57315.1 ferrochelatase [Oleiphilus sp. HI0125]